MDLHPPPTLDLHPPDSPFSSLSLPPILDDPCYYSPPDLPSSSSLHYVEEHDRALFLDHPSSSSSSSSSSSFPAPPFSSTYEPLSDPAFSYIYDILSEEDDALAAKEPSFSYGELVALKAKASEVAAILQEDSPRLSLNATPSTLNNNNNAHHGSTLPFLIPLVSAGDDPYPDNNTVSQRIPPQQQQHPPPKHYYFQPLSATSGGYHLIKETFIDRPLLWATLAANVKGGAMAMPNCLLPIKPIVFESLPESLSLTSTSSAAGFGGQSNPRCAAAAGSSKHERERDNNAAAGALKMRRESAGTRKRCGRKARGGAPPRKESESSDHDDHSCRYVHINDLLLQCAQAAGMNSTNAAMEMLKKVRQHASPHGDGAQRLAYYFAEAMEARFSGTGWRLYKEGGLGLRGGGRAAPSSEQVLKAMCKYMESCPFAKASHYYINQTILDLVKWKGGGGWTLNIMELQGTKGLQYPWLFKALAGLPDGPPKVRLIAVAFPHYAMPPPPPSDHHDHDDTNSNLHVLLDDLHRSGRHLSDIASSLGVPFHFTAWAGSRHDLRMQDFVAPSRPPHHLLVVVSAHLLRFVMDHSLDSPFSRSKLLKMGLHLLPDLYIQGIVTGSYNTPFFTRRYREALFHFESVYDVLDTFIEREDADRAVFESEILGKAILNIVACEGTDVIERVDRYKHWQAVTEEVGFEQLPLDADIRDNVQAMLKSLHKEYTVAEDSQYLLMGWKGRMLHAMSTWRARASPPTSSTRDRASSISSSSCS